MGVAFSQTCCDSEDEQLFDYFCLGTFWGWLPTPKPRDSTVFKNLLEVPYYPIRMKSEAGIRHTPGPETHHKGMLQDRQKDGQKERDMPVHWYDRCRLPYLGEFLCCDLFLYNGIQICCNYEAPPRLKPRMKFFYHKIVLKNWFRDCMGHGDLSAWRQ